MRSALAAAVSHPHPHAHAPRGLAGSLLRWTESSGLRGAAAGAGGGRCRAAVTAVGAGDRKSF